MQLTILSQDEARFWLWNGNPGDYIWNEETGRCIKRIDTEFNGRPNCKMYENWNDTQKTGDYVCDMVIDDALDWYFS